MNRVIERSREARRRMDNRQQQPQEEARPGEITQKTMDQLRNKDNISTLVREWIKTISKELFHPEMSEVTELKSILFLFMDNLLEKSR